MAYRYGQPVQKAKRNIKGYIIGIGASLAMLVGAAIPSMAAGNSSITYDNNPGRQQAIEAGAQCDSGAGSGAFNAFGGQDNNFAGGADGQATGMNNSAVCGNRQGNL